MSDTMLAATADTSAATNGTAAQTQAPPANGAGGAPAQQASAPTTAAATAPTPAQAPAATTPPVIPAVPDTYALVLPAGSLLKPAQVEQVAAFAKAHKLTQEQAQTLLAQRSEAVTAHQESVQQEWQVKSAQWVETIKADPEIGGAAFGKNAELAKRVVARFGSEALKSALNETGLGNHPELFRFVVRIGALMSEDQLVVPSGASAGSAKEAASVLYDNTK